MTNATRPSTHSNHNGIISVEDMYNASKVHQFKRSKNGNISYNQLIKPSEKPMYANWTKFKNRDCADFRAFAYSFYYPYSA